MALHLLIAMTCAMLLATVANSAANMGSFSITATGQLTMIQQWALTTDLAGFRLMAQDLGLGAPPNSFYSIAGSVIPPGGNTSAFTHYIAASGFPTRHSDLGNKLTPDSYSALTSADPDIGFGEVNFYLIHHKGSTDYFTTIVPSTGTASAVTDLKPMSGPGGPGTVTGVSGYFALTFAAANLGYGANMFYFLRVNATTGKTSFGSIAPALTGASTSLFSLAHSNYTAIEFVAADLGFGVNQMVYLRQDLLTGFTIFGTLNPSTGAEKDIANLGGVFTTITHTSSGVGTDNLYTTGSLMPNWQSISFAALNTVIVNSSGFFVHPTASSGLALTLSVVLGSVGTVNISGPVAGVFKVTPLTAGSVTLRAQQGGSSAFQGNFLQQTFIIPPVPQTSRTLRLAGNFTAILANASAKSFIIAAVTSDLVAVLGLNVTVTDVREGSLIVDFTTNGTDATITDRVAFAASNSSWLGATQATYSDLGSAGALVVIGLAETPTTAPAMPPTVTPSSSSSVWSLTVVSLVTAMVTFGVAIL